MCFDVSVVCLGLDDCYHVVIMCCLSWTPVITSGQGVADLVTTLPRSHRNIRNNNTLKGTSKKCSLILYALYECSVPLIVHMSMFDVLVVDTHRNDVKIQVVVLNRSVKSFIIPNTTDPCWWGSCLGFAKYRKNKYRLFCFKQFCINVIMSWEIMLTLLSFQITVTSIRDYVD